MGVSNRLWDQKVVKILYFNHRLNGTIFKIILCIQI